VSGANPATFELDGKEYPIKPRVFPIIQSHLHSKESVEWVSCEEPYVKYGVRTKNGSVKTVVRMATELLTGSEIGRVVISTLALNSIRESQN
jgi:hypothetical protein